MSAEVQIDALLPPEMAAKAEQTGIKKANMDRETLLTLAVIAGAFVSLGAMFATTVIAGAGDKLTYGEIRLLFGMTFTLGLILILVGGAELFTGNTLIVMAWANRKVSTLQLLRNWVIVYTGNLIGSLLTAGLIFAGGQYSFGKGVIGATALVIADNKVNLDFAQAIALGIMCNAMVCMAVWLTFSARTTTDRILAIIPPIAGFAAAGFEHSIANMYFIPMALLIKTGATPTFWADIGKTPADFPRLTWDGFLAHNLLPVTIGNIIGGAILVGAVYWFIYLRPHQAATVRDARRHHDVFFSDR